MRVVKRVAFVDENACNGCSVCVRICPVEAIRLERHSERRVAVINEQGCLDCTLCVTRCPEHAVRMMERGSPFRVEVDVSRVSQEEVARLCEAGHMYPDQVICYCHRVQAREVAAAILLGARTPEDVSRATGARTGCATLCITTITRLLRAAGIALGEAPGYQWYGTEITMWNLPAGLEKRYPHYYVAEDVRSINRLFPGGK